MKNMDGIDETPIIVFDDTVKDKVLKAVGYSKDKDSNLVDEKGRLVTSQDYDSISYEEFGGVLRSSKVPIEKKNSELVKYFISRTR